MSALAVDESLQRKVIEECLSINCCQNCSLRFSGERHLDKFKLDDEPACDDAAGDDAPPSKKQKTAICVYCFDMLSAARIRQVSEESVRRLKEAGYDDPVFTTTLSMPVCTLIRDKSIYLHLKQTVPGYSDQVRFNHLLPLKEVWKHLLNPGIADGTGKSADNGYFADLLVNVEVTYRGDRRELEVIRKLQPRSGDQVTRMQADAVLETAAEARLYRHLSVPPDTAVQPADHQVACTHNPIFLAGRYNKYSRELSQTPWYVNGVRRTASSLQEMLTDLMVSRTRASGVRFSASGREDVDVRTLGRGRPFIAELLDPHLSRLTPADLRSLQAEVNAAHPEIYLRDLQLVSREETCNLKAGEEEKSKCYTALVQCLSGPAGAAGLGRLAEVRDLQVSQLTPVRVLHRRPLAVRQRTVHWLRAQPVTDRLFKLSLKTQAGTYIKEFVHGDLGRTEPSLGSLLNGRFDILALDVESVELDWPPALSEEQQNGTTPSVT